MARTEAPARGLYRRGSPIIRQALRWKFADTSVCADALNRSTTGSYFLFVNSIRTAGQPWDRHEWPAAPASSRRAVLSPARAEIPLQM